MYVYIFRSTDKRVGTHPTWRGQRIFFPFFQLCGVAFSLQAFYRLPPWLSLLLRRCE